jgi:N-acetylmuramoyl-L-alanine amidase
VTPSFATENAALRRNRAAWRRRAGAVFLFAALLLAVFAPPARALVSFTAEIHDEIRTATVAPVRTERGAEYVSLPSLVRQLGGGVRVSANRIKVDLSGATADLGVGETGVSATHGNFELQYPLVSTGDDVLVALADVSPFLFQAFQLFASRHEGETGRDTASVQSVPLLEPSSPAAPDPAPAAEEAGLLTPIAPPAPELDPSAPPVEAPTPAPEPEAPAQVAAAAPAAPTATLSGVRSIVIDPGHGGYDTGALGPGGLAEKEAALAIALEVGRILKEEAGLTVYLTRQEDKDLPLPQRVDLVNEARGDLLVSVHLGAAPGPDARGFHVYYWGGADPAAGRPGRHAVSSRALAEALAAAVSRAMGAVWADHGVHEAPLRLLQGVNMPGVLVELGCITNDEDAALLARDTERARIARAIAEGVRAAVSGGGAP